MPAVLSPSTWEDVFAPFRGQRVGYLRANGNIGDWLIDAATKQLCGHFGVELIEVTHGLPLPCTLQAIFSAGAGNFGKYELERRKREWALSTGLPVTVLPQTGDGYSEHHLAYEKVWFRDHRSLKYHHRSDIAPDLALGYDCPQFMGGAANGTDGACGTNGRRVGLFLRRGWEQIAETHPQDLGDPAGMAASVEAYLKLAASWDHIITNRLHFAIAGLLQRRKVTLLPNSYHKCRSIFCSSLQALGCGWADTAAAAWEAAQ